MKQQNKCSQKKTKSQISKSKISKLPHPKKTKFQNPNPKAFTKFHKSKIQKSRFTNPKMCLYKMFWTLDPLQNQKPCPKISCLYKIATQT